MRAIVVCRPVVTVLLDGFVGLMLFIRAVSKGRGEEMREDNCDVAQVLCVCINDANFVVGYSEFAVE